MTEATTARRRATQVGVVTSTKMAKSVVVRVDRTVLHDVYKRHVRRTSRFMAHDENGQCKVGDTVEIVESRPLSRSKRWRVRRVVRQAVGVEPTDMAGSRESKP
jgi:small subunit ribosomal protein S17